MSSSTDKSIDTSSNASQASAQRDSAASSPSRSFLPSPKQPVRWGRVFISVLVIAAIAAGVAGYRVVRRFVSYEEKYQQIIISAVSETNLKSAQALQATEKLEARFSQLTAQVERMQDLTQDFENFYQTAMHDQEHWLLTQAQRSVIQLNGQLKSSSDVPLVIAALERIHAQLSKLHTPRSNKVRQAIADDLSALKSLSIVDTLALANELAQAIEQVDNLPFVGETQLDAKKESAVPSDSSTSNNIWMRLRRAVVQQWMSLIQVRHIGQPEAMRVTPSERYLLLENLKWQLRFARLGLLSHQITTLAADLQAAEKILTHYFEVDSPKVKAIKTAIEHAKQATGSFTLPDLNKSEQTLYQVTHSSSRLDENRGE